MTLKMIHKKYKDKYIEVDEHFDWSKKETIYEIIHVYSKIHENTTLGQDLGTEKEYTR